MCKLIIKLIAFCFVLFTHVRSTEIEERENTCGFKKITRTPKIINGKDAYHGQFPWAISLRLHKRHHCGGALINHNWVLTAAHCVSGVNYKAFTVKLGGHYRNTEHEPTSVELQVVKSVPHDGFSFTSFANDIALLKLSRSVEYNNYVWPVCLPGNNTAAEYADQTGVVIGWGKVTPQGVSATSLQQVELPIIDNAKCVKWYESQGKMIPIRSTQFCAGLEEGGKDACQGDSGSPMMKLDKGSGQAVAIGIVSAGIGCALPKLPGLYTRIAAFMPWVKNQLALNSQEATLPPTTPSKPPPTLPQHPQPVPHLPTGTQKPVLPEIHPGFNHSRPIITIPPNNHTVVISLPILIHNLTQIHHNLNKATTAAHSTVPHTISSQTTSAPVGTSTPIPMLFKSAKTN